MPVNRNYNFQTHILLYEFDIFCNMYACVWQGRGGMVANCTWWRHEMETFSALLAICVGNSPVPGEVPAQRAVTRSFDVFFALRLNKRLSKQSWGWWFETPSRLLWRHHNDQDIVGGLLFFLWHGNTFCFTDPLCLTLIPRCGPLIFLWYYRQISNRSGTKSQNRECYSSGLAVVFAQSIDARC